MKLIRWIIATLLILITFIVGFLFLPFIISDNANDTGGGYQDFP